MASKVVTASITAENSFTDWIELKGIFDISVGGSGWTATVTLQRSFDSGTTKLNVEPFTSATEKYVIAGSKAYYRIGVATGDFGSGTIPVRIQQ